LLRAANLSENDQIIKFKITSHLLRFVIKTCLRAKIPLLEKDRKVGKKSAGVQLLILSSARDPQREFSLTRRFSRIPP
jgi:hypothetical protein